MYWYIIFDYTSVYVVNTSLIPTVAKPNNIFLR